MTNSVTPQEIDAGDAVKGFSYITTTVGDHATLKGHELVKAGTDLTTGLTVLIDADGVVHSAKNNAGNFVYLIRSI